MWINSVVIVGQKWLAEQVFNLCIERNITVLAVSPPSAQDRLAQVARLHAVPVRIHAKHLTAEQVPPCDMILCAHAYCFVTAKARAKARLGAVGYHPSLLPAYKGKHAIANTLEAGERVTGGSLYQLDDGWDTGGVLRQGCVEIDPADTPTTLWRNKLSPLGLKLFGDFLAYKQL